MGNLFEHMVQHKIVGRTLSDRVDVLAAWAFSYYEKHRTEDRLKLFVRASWFESATKPPTLRGNAASVRALVGFGAQIATEYMSDDVPIENAIKTAATNLHNCYNALHGPNELFGKDALYQSSKAFAQQYKSLFLAHGADVMWRPMPKMHMFLELCSQRTEPSKFWCYRDEDFGGSVARQSRMKGSWRKVSAFGKHALDLFKMKNDAPRIVRFT